MGRSPKNKAHVVVLAAGRGSRLGALGGETPKWLLRVGGRTLADRQLAGIGLAARAVASTRVVTGHAAGAIERHVAAHAADVALVPNPEFAELNNWWSLLRALRELPDEGPVAVINADLLLDADRIAEFITAVATAPAEALIAVDLERELTDESMKVSRDGADALAEIGKVGVEAPVGEYIGMLAARGEALRALRDKLEGFVDRDESRDEWYERAVGLSAAAGVQWAIWPVPGGDWVEIDDEADLELARELTLR